ncbi:uncharacterized protein LOC141611390 [Silene latifolia]|uniref:uncharacterized protein LOC141611390 n=1 Tax=Silene latifolia TaxID=37657 RepID=UPI003D777713
MSGTNDKEVKLSLKLMVDTKAKKVVFAEASKDFVDFVFHLLSIPLAKVVNHLKDKGMIGCLGSVYNSLNSLDSDYLEPNVNKDSILNPQVNHFILPVLSRIDTPSSSFGVFQSSSTFGGVSTTAGFVKSTGHYMVLDDLEVKPMTISLLKYHAIEFDKLEEKVVQVGLQEAVEILRASLTTKAVLTTVFLGKDN